MNAPAFSLADLRSRLHYDEATGAFTWLAYADKLGRPNTQFAGRVAGVVWADASGRQYRQITIFGFKTYAHRLAWFYMTGEWIPLIDHKDRDGLNNRWINLRAATKAQNAANSGSRRDNVSGFKGVHLDQRRQRYVAQIKRDGRSRFLGYFDTAEAAHAAYAAQVRAHDGEFAGLI